ncbi:hypothetical protein UCRPC4_g06664 [Phaeomoniella chlamydospora]|uniref:Uncharacterized protein n=1 Tax=Phaeomoniella chlamydospora TaxID=158046 RepID=A0A0G2DWU3_PHACM|nr:hypothetical protein UCRPC4_g06664 [Phaeomoniella chlamydospora]
MSGAEVIAVVACVAAVVSAYRDGSGLVRKIRERRRARRALREAETQQLESSLELGPVVVQGQYDHDFRRFGEEYARGDQIAREQMKDVLITLQLQILHNLRGIWDTDAEIDYVAIQHASDESRVNAVVCLGQLYQRLAVAAPPNAMQIPVSYGQYPSYLQHLAPLHNMSGYPVAGT